jgi:hypothetical protein
LIGKTAGRYNLEDRGMDEKIILKWISEKMRECEMDSMSIDGLF